MFELNFGISMQLQRDAVIYIQSPLLRVELGLFLVKFCIFGEK